MIRTHASTLVKLKPVQLEGSALKTRPLGDVLRNAKVWRESCSHGKVDTTASVVIYEAASIDTLSRCKMLGIEGITGKYTRSYQPASNATQPAEVDTYVSKRRAANGY